MLKDVDSTDESFDDGNKQGTKVWDVDVEKILAVRRKKPSDMSNYDSNNEELEVLLKYLNVSYRAVTWESESDVMNDFRGRLLYSRYKTRHLKEDLSFIEEHDFSHLNAFNNDYLQIDRIIARKFENAIILDENQDNTKSKKNVSYSEMLLVKWKGLNYSESTWEFTCDLEGVNDEAYIEKFRHRMSEVDKKILGKKIMKGNVYNIDISESLTMKDIPISNIDLRDYQIAGINWMLYQWSQCRSCLLADEMGLGKTLQTIGFIEALRLSYEAIDLPCLIIVPLSVLAHWQEQFENHTDASVIIFQGSKADRDLIKKYEFTNYKGKKFMPHFNIMVTTYDAFIAEPTYLSSISWSLLVVDEGHRLKNEDGLFRTHLDKLNVPFRLLLSGTPIQNNLLELFSLLQFMNNKDFDDSEAFMTKYSAIESNDTAITIELQNLLKKYMLRREKKDVEFSIPKKCETVIDVELTVFQKQYYRAILENNRHFLTQSDKYKSYNLNSIISELRKVCNHPYLVVGGRAAAESKEESLEVIAKKFVKTAEVIKSNNISAEIVCSNQPPMEIRNNECSEQHNDPINTDPLIYSSGKIVLLHKLLYKLKQEKSRVLIFSQFIETLNIIEEYLANYGYKFERLDGSVKNADRAAAIKNFTNDEDIFVFLLTTRAGGVGINLQVANVVIIFDSDWNPQADIQAVSRSHRLGQNKEVKVYRLLTSKTIEQKIFSEATKKLVLSETVMNSSSQYNKLPKDVKSVDNLLRLGSYEILNEEDNTGNLISKKFMNDTIDEILHNNSKEIVYDEQNDSKSLFSTVLFIPDNNSINIDYNDSKFWEKTLPVGTSVPNRIKEMFIGDINLAILKNSAELSGQLFQKITSHCEYINKQRVAGMTPDDTDDTILLLDSVISSDIYVDYNGYLLTLKNSIEKPKRQRNNIILDDFSHITDVDGKNSRNKKNKTENTEKLKKIVKRNITNPPIEAVEFTDISSENLVFVSLFIKFFQPIYFKYHPDHVSILTSDPTRWRQFLLTAWRCLTPNEQLNWRSRHETLRQIILGYQIQHVKEFDTNQLIKSMISLASEKAILWLTTLGFNTSTSITIHGIKDNTSGQSIPHEYSHIWDQYFIKTMTELFIIDDSGKVNFKFAVKFSDLFAGEISHLDFLQNANIPNEDKLNLYAIFDNNVTAHDSGYSLTFFESIKSYQTQYDNLVSTLGYHIDKSSYNNCVKKIVTFYTTRKDLIEYDLNKSKNEIEELKKLVTGYEFFPFYVNLPFQIGKVSVGADMLDVYWCNIPLFLTLSTFNMSFFRDVETSGVTIISSMASPHIGLDTPCNTFAVQNDILLSINGKCCIYRVPDDIQELLRQDSLTLIVRRYFPSIERLYGDLFYDDPNFLQKIKVMVDLMKNYNSRSNK